MISTGAVIGRSHRLLGMNGQDAVYAGNGWGVVLDGCGSKHRDENGRLPSHNEIGSTLLGQYLAGRLAHPERVDVGALYGDCLTFLQKLLALYTFDEQEKVRFVASHLLCTVVGFVVQDALTTFFWSGDGHLVMDGEVVVLESGNMPNYLAYQLLTPDDEAGFETHTIPTPAWCAVATDGWQAHHLRQLEIPQKPLKLQRWMNQLAREKGVFEDDGATAVWWHATPS